MESPLRRVLLALCLAVFSGCTLLPRPLQPSQLWKLNRQPPRDEGRFSVPDPVDQRLAGPLADTRSERPDTTTPLP